MSNDDWLANPQDGNYDNPNNWSEGRIPDTNDLGADFGASTITTVSLGSEVAIENFIQSGAPAYSFNLSAAICRVVLSGSFFNGSSNTVSFSLTDNAQLYLFDSTNVGFTGNFDITIDSTSEMFVQGEEVNDGINSCVITTNGSLLFEGNASAGTARLINNAGGVVDFSANASTFLVTAGSIEGAGTYDLGSYQLTVGFDNLSTEVSGSIEDGGINGGTGGSLVMDGTGTLTLTGSNTYSGGTTVTAGTVQLGDGGAAGSIVGNVTDNATFVVDLSGTLTLGSLSGSGAFQQIGTGTTILTQSGSFSGTVMISAGTLQLDDGGTAASFTGGVTDNATFVVDLSETFTLGSLSGSGAFQQLGTGTIILTADSDGFTGTTTISAGTLQLGDGGTAGSIAGSVIDDANLAIDRSDTFTFGGTISGTEAFQQIGTGTTILTADSDSFTGGTTISAGTLQLDDGGTSASIAGSVTDDAMFAIDRSDIYTFGGAISGTGAFQQIGTGTTILTASESYGGGTTISAGTLQLGNGITDGTITGNVTDNATFADDDSGTYTFGGTISGTEAFQQIGTGTTILT
ncbi:MAG TPA: autotransporter-associated beta strand repeat-containing protein, partial [Xanthobacteraceae bacterium]|nr:autotransporter-associated beta strand repeat-containing protein [Xanthobacteraceae bacterium]